jgi:hypothetical protein
MICSELNLTSTALLEALLMGATNRLPRTISRKPPPAIAKPLPPGHDAELHANLSTARLGRIAEAIPQFEIALSIDANLEAVKQNLSAARSKLQTHQ